MRYKGKKLINDANGVWKSVDGQPVKLLRDPSGRFTRSEDLDGDWSMSFYDHNGLLVLQEIYKNGERYFRFLERDQRGRVIFEKEKENIREYTYLPDGRRKALTSNYGVHETYEYDSRGFLVYCKGRQYDTLGGFFYDFKAEHIYDAYGREVFWGRYTRGKEGFKSYEACRDNNYGKAGMEEDWVGTWTVSEWPDTSLNGESRTIYSSGRCISYSRGEWYISWDQAVALKQEIIQNHIKYDEKIHPAVCPFKVRDFVKPWKPKKVAINSIKESYEKETN